MHQLNIAGIVAELNSKPSIRFIIRNISSAVSTTSDTCSARQRAAFPAPFGKMIELRRTIPIEAAENRE